MTWPKSKVSHTLQIGINLRQIDNIRESNSTSYFTGLTNSFWLAGSCISNCGTSLDPAAFGFPAVDSSFATGYDFPVTALAGLITQVGSNYNLTKTLTALPEGALVPRHFHGDEWEWYGQDSWHVKPNLTVTYGLRYTLLLAPYETNGQEVAPTFSLANWFNQRAADQVHGETYDPLISFGLAGKANGGKPYWNTDFGNFAPRLAFAYSPSGDSELGAGSSGAGREKVLFELATDCTMTISGRESLIVSIELGAFGLTTSINESRWHSDRGHFRPLFCAEHHTRHQRCYQRKLPRSALPHSGAGSQRLFPCDASNQPCRRRVRHHMGAE